MNARLSLVFAATTVLLCGAAVSAEAPAKPTTAPRSDQPMAERFVFARPWLERASKEAGAIEDAGQRLMTRGSIAELYAKAGELDGYLAAMKEMEADEDKVGPEHPPSPMYRYSGAQSLIPMLVKAGKTAEADRLVMDLSTSEQYYPGALGRMAETLAEAGDYKGAEKYVSEAPEGKTDALLVYLGQGQARRRDEKAALETMARIEAPNLGSGIQVTLVKAYIDAGDFAAAARIAERVPENYRESAKSMIVHGQTKEKKFAEARKTIDAMPAGQRERLMLELAFRQQQAGDLEGMRATVRDMSGQSQEVPGVCMLARELVKGNDEAGARRVMESIADEKVRKRALDTLPQILVMSSAEAGDVKRAEAHLMELPAAKRNFTLCLSVATAMHKAGDRAGYQRMIQAAQTWADDANNKFDKGSAYRQIAYNLGMAGDEPGALKLAGQLSDAKAKDGALAGAVNGLVQAGHIDKVWPLIKEMRAGPERRAAFATASLWSVACNQTSKLSGHIDGLEPVERAMACISMARGYVEPVAVQVNK